jgi:hypothetical protein
MRKVKITKETLHSKERKQGTASGIIKEETRQLKAKRKKYYAERRRRQPSAPTPAL